MNNLERSNALGVITAFASTKTLEDFEVQDQEIYRRIESECYFVHSFDAEESSILGAIPKPCGKLIWKGGNVSGLNKDVNVINPITD